MEVVGDGDLLAYGEGLWEEMWVGFRGLEDWGFLEGGRVRVGFAEIRSIGGGICERARRQCQEGF